MNDTQVPDHLVPVTKTQRQKDHEAKIAYIIRFRYAEGLLMQSGGRDRPRGSTVRRMLRTLGRNGPRAMGARILVGKSWEHPTKRRAGWA